MSQIKPIIEIVNVVASATLDQELDLDDIQQKIPDIEYVKEQFPGAIFRIKNPKTATLLFRTGKMVCTGARSEELAKKAVKTVIQQLKKNGVKIKGKPTIEIQNIVSAVNLQKYIHIERAVRQLPRSMYEPEQFPGLIHRMVDPKTVILIFSSGKLVCTGARKEEDVYRSVNGLNSTLEEKGLFGEK